ncbi:hypothetical protein [Bradyrhizobium sp. NC92]|uniref:hypothetical protein n=1 Tax=Bradyrhizobium sp. (strain NC92) TaxID=55395 RepID=UPI0021AA72FF|nr:hypothetical protein [Bradyrhizobium sp. NC92]UWU72963.1 hypothetical protein N2602_32815 [Bradyrhizobium sp. NC92]
MALLEPSYRNRQKAPEIVTEHLSQSRATHLPSHPEGVPINELARLEGASSIIVSLNVSNQSELESITASTMCSRLKAAPQYKSISKEERLRLHMQQNNLKWASTSFYHCHIPAGTHIARKRGLLSISIMGGVVSALRLRAARPDFTINSHHELLPILQRRGVFRNA